MPLPTAHGLLGAGLVAALYARPVSGRRAVPLLVGALLANAADLDFLLVFALGSRRGTAASHTHFASPSPSLWRWPCHVARRRLTEAAAYASPSRRTAFWTS